MVNYQKRRAAQERLTMFPKLVEIIEANKKRMLEQKKWDQSSPEWKEHVKEIAKTKFGGTEEQWKVWCAEILEPFADRFWDVGCAAPVIQGFEGDIVPKPGCQPSARRPFRLSEYDEARLEQRLHEFEEAGQLYRVAPDEAGEWSSPAFVVDKQGDLLEAGHGLCRAKSANRRPSWSASGCVAGPPEGGGEELPQRHGHGLGVQPDPHLRESSPHPHDRDPQRSVAMAIPANGP